MPDEPLSPPVGVIVELGGRADTLRLEPPWLQLHRVHQAADRTC